MWLNPDLDYSWLISYTEKQQIIWARERIVISITLIHYFSLPITKTFNEINHKHYKIQDLGQDKCIFNLPTPFKNASIAKHNKSFHDTYVQ